MEANNDRKSGAFVPDAEQFMQQARDVSGLSDYGDESFVKPFRMFLDCVARDTNFHAQGLKEFKTETVRNLVNRLRFQNDLKRHPEILDEDVSDPIIVLGMPRSGTTKTLRMLASDPNLLTTRQWQLLNPAPFPNAAPGQQDPRIEAAGLYDNLAKGRPEFHAAHHMGVNAYEGELPLFDLTFNDWSLNNRNPSRLWHQWVLARTEPSDIDNHLYVRSLLQYLQWQEGGRKNRRRLMKPAGHPAFLEELLLVYPRATVLSLHRHPYECLASYATLWTYLWSMRIEGVELKSTSEFIFDYCKTWVDRYMESRDRLGSDSRIIDVQYEQIRNDPMPVFRKLYQRANHTLTAEAEQKMMEWEKHNEQGKHGAHTYSLEKLGLSEKQIDEALGPYIHRFIKKK